MLGYSFWSSYRYSVFSHLACHIYILLYTKDLIGLSSLHCSHLASNILIIVNLYCFAINGSVTMNYHYLPCHYIFHISWIPLPLLLLPLRTTMIAIMRVSFHASKGSYPCCNKNMQKRNYKF